MTTSEIVIAGVTVLAIVLGPLLAILITPILSEGKEKRQRKIDIFKALMATRHHVLHWEHVRALNQIELEFDKSNSKEKEVIDAWVEYLDILGEKGIAYEQWRVKKTDLFIELLYKMSVVLDYDFDKTRIKNSFYAPIAYADIEEQERQTKAKALDFLSGKVTLPMHVVNFPTENDATTEKDKTVDN